MQVPHLRRTSDEAWGLNRAHAIVHGKVAHATAEHGRIECAHAFPETMRYGGRLIATSAGKRDSAIPQQLGDMFKTVLGIYDPDPTSSVVDSLGCQPCDCNFLLAGVAVWICAGVERKKSLGLCNPVANSEGDRCLFRDVVFVTPNAHVGRGESIQQRSCTIKVVPAIAEEEVSGGRHRCASLNAIVVQTLALADGASYEGPVFEVPEALWDIGPPLSPSV